MAPVHAHRGRYSPLPRNKRHSSRQGNFVFHACLAECVCNQCFVTAGCQRRNTDQHENQSNKAKDGFLHRSYPSFHCRSPPSIPYTMILIIFSRFRPIDHCLGSAQNCCSCNPRKTIDLHGYRSEYEMEFVRRAVSACACFLLL